MQQLICLIGVKVEKTESGGTVARPLL